MEKICGNCKYYDGNIPLDDSAECHRFPPLMHPVQDKDYIRFYWPDVDVGDFCGEFKAKKNWIKKIEVKK